MKVRKEDMSEVIIFLIMVALLSLGSIVMVISDYMDAVHHRRRQNKINFLKSHSGYGLDKDGNIVKL